MMIDLSASTDPDLAVAAQVLAVLDACAKAVGAEYMVVGATARDILAAALVDRRPGRATRDVDIAVGVADWKAFERLTAGLVPRRAGHAFTVQAFGGAVEVDIIPYGGVEEPDRSAISLLGTTSTSNSSARTGSAFRFANSPDPEPVNVSSRFLTMPGFERGWPATWGDQARETPGAWMRSHVGSVTSAESSEAVCR